MHYLRWYTRGGGREFIALNGPLRSGGVPREMNPVRRFLSRVDKTATCWLWTGRLDDSGYGRFAVNGRQIGAHRYSYELHVGPIPDGLQIDHLCRVRNCVNPEHLEPVTAQENVRRAIPWRPKTRAAPTKPRAKSDKPRKKRVVTVIKTHCKQGHEFDEANTYHYRGKRSCRACDAARKRRRYSLDAM